MNSVQVGFIYTLVVGFLLTACSGKSANSPTQPTASPFPPASASVPHPTEDSEIGCTMVAVEPTPAPASNSLISPVTKTDFTIGPDNAPVTLIEYCDFQAPICRSMAAVVSNLYNVHPNDLRFVFRPVPAIGRLDKSQFAVQAVLAAQEQDKFWEMYDVLFQKNSEWDGLTIAEFNSWVVNEAGHLGLDKILFEGTLTSQETAAQAKTLYDSAIASGVQSFPLLMINGKPQPLFALDFYSLDTTISLILLGDRQFTECPPFRIEPALQYFATLHTQRGDIVIELFADQAPLAVNSFIFLSRQGWFDEVTFHRVIPGFAAQTGDPSGTGKGNPGYFFNNEISNLKFDRPGVVGMANSGPDTNGSQFFITYEAAPHLDGSYTVFGQVISGMDILDQLTPRDPEQRPDLPPGDILLNVEIEER